MLFLPQDIDLYIISNYFVFTRIKLFAISQLRELVYRSGGREPLKLLAATIAFSRWHFSLCSSSKQSVFLPLTRKFENVFTEEKNHVKNET